MQIIKLMNMRNKILLLLILVTSFSSAQWSVEAGMGGHLVDDQRGSVLDDNFNHYNGTLRYMANRKIGLGLNYGHDNLSFVNGTDLKYNRLNLKVYSDILDIVDLDNSSVALLGSFGPGVSSFRQKRPDNGIPTEYSFNLSGGAAAIFNLGGNWGLKFDWTTTAHFGQEYSLDYSKESCDGITSLIHNFSGGLVYYMGKKRDFERRRTVADTIYMEPQVFEKTTRQIYVVQNKRTCECDCIDYVYFDFGKTDINEKGQLNVIEKVSDCLTASKKIVLKGFACSVYGTPERNYELAKLRVKEVKEHLISIGIQENQIEEKVIGNDWDRRSDTARKFARRVEISVVDK